MTDESACARVLAIVCGTDDACGILGFATLSTLDEVAYSYWR